MRKKYKMTGCAKFMIFLLFAVPAAYFISAYYHGEDGLTTIKEKLNLEKILKKDNTDVQTANIENTENLMEKIEKLEEQVESLKNDLAQKDLEIQNLKSQIQALQEE